MPVARWSRRAPGRPTRAPRRALGSRGEGHRPERRGSAQAEHDKRAARYAEDLRRRRPRILATCLAIAILGLVVLVAVSPIWGAVVWMFDGLLLMSALFTTPNSITAWQTGAEGEAQTGLLLEPLGADGFRILHDRRIPRSRANIDHIVIGPPGIFAVETKSYAGSLQIRGDEVFVAGRRKGGWVPEARREAAAVETALADEIAAHGWTVTPVICVHRADLPWLRSEVQGMRVVSGKDLVSRLRKAEPVLTPADVERLAALADARLRPAFGTPDRPQR